MPRLAAQPSRQVGDRADRGVILSPFKSDRTYRGISGRYADPCTEMDTPRLPIFS